MRMILLAGMLVAAATVSAAPKPPTPSTIALHPSSDLRLGGWVLFEVTFPKSAEKFGPRIQVLCYQDDVLVYGAAGQYFEPFKLGGAASIWVYDSPGPAHCVADLYYWSYRGEQKFNWLASVEFDAAG